MKKNFLKVGFMVMLAFMTTVTLTSCGGEEAAEGDATEQTDGDDEGKCEEGKCEEGKCEEGKCEDGKCESGDHKCEEGKCESGDHKCEEGKCEEGKCESAK